MFCNKCGKEVSENATFCKNCGNKLNNTKKENLNNWMKKLKILLLISIIGIIITGITASSTSLYAMWEISKVVTLIVILMFLIVFVICTVISIKDKEKVPIWFTIIQGIAVAFIIIAIIANLINKKNEQSLKENINKYNSGTQNNQKTNSPYITLEEFNKVQIGMTYEEVVEIIGGNGDLIAEDSYNKTYSWDPSSNSDMYSVTMTFYNNILSSKVKF